MSQHDMGIANAAGAAIRADLNLALAALVSNSSGATEPATMFAYQFWADTTTGLLKIRNAANSAWVTIGTLASQYLGLGFPAGTRMPFNQTAAPTGWTKDTTAALNDTAMRIVTGAVGSGGTVAFTTAFASQAVGGTISSVAAGTSDATTISVAQMPSHTHSATSDAPASPDTKFGTGGGGAYPGSLTTAAQGGGGSHTHTHTATHSHTLTGTAINLAVKYNDFIIASKA